MNKFHKTLAKNCAGAPQIHMTSASINTNTSCKNTNTSCTTQIHHQKRPIHNANVLNTSRYKHKKNTLYPSSELCQGTSFHPRSSASTKTMLGRLGKFSPSAKVEVQPRWRKITNLFRAAIRPGPLSSTFKGRW